MSLIGSNHIALPSLAATIPLAASMFPLAVASHFSIETEQSDAVSQFTLENLQKAYLADLQIPVFFTPSHHSAPISSFKPLPLVAHPCINSSILVSIENVYNDSFPSQNETIRGQLLQLTLGDDCELYEAQQNCVDKNFKPYFPFPPPEDLYNGSISWSYEMPSELSKQTWRVYTVGKNISQNGGYAMLIERMQKLAECEAKARDRQVTLFATAMGGIGILAIGSAVFCFYRRRQQSLHKEVLQRHCIPTYNTFPKNDLK